MFKIKTDKLNNIMVYLINIFFFSNSTLFEIVSWSLRPSANGKSGLFNRGQEPQELKSRLNG